jgi:hypothetical protein
MTDKDIRKGVESESKDSQEYLAEGCCTKYGILGEREQPIPCARSLARSHFY